MVAHVIAVVNTASINYYVLLGGAKKKLKNNNIYKSSVTAIKPHAIF